MMYNTCSSYSSVIALRRRTYFGFNDFSCNFNPNRNCPSNYCSCCCLFPVNSSRLMMPMNLNPNLLYGLRQSTLIRKRVILGFNDWDCYRSSNYDVGCCCCVKNGKMAGRKCIVECCVEKRKFRGVGRVSWRNGSDNVGKIRVRVSKCERDFRCNALDDFEAMLSLLSEEGIEDCVAIGGRGKNSSNDARGVKEQNVVMGKRKVVKYNVLLGSECLESKSSTKEDFREKGHKRREERNSLLNGEGRKSRRRESCSSFYSVSNSGESESESESEVDVKEEIIFKSSTSQRKDSRKSGGVVISEVNDDAVKSYRDEKDQQLINSRPDDVRVGSSMEWDLRKKSKKSLTDESSEVNRTIKESVTRQSKLSQVNENSAVMASSSKKQFNYLEEVSNLDVNSHRQSRTNAKKYDSLNEYTKSSGRRQQSTTHLKFHKHSESQARELEQSISDVRSSGQLKSEIVIDNKASEIMSSGPQSRTNAQKVENLSDYTKSSGRHEHSTAHVKVHEHSESRVSELEQSISGVSSRGQSKSRIVIDNQANEYLKSSQQNEQALTKRQNVDSITTTRKPVHGKGVMVLGGQSLQEMGCDYCKTCGRSVQGSKIETGINQHTDISEIYGRYSEKVDSDYRYGQSMVKKQNQSETRIKKLEEMSPSVESPYDVKNSQELSGGRIIKETESGKLRQTEASPSEIGSTGIYNDGCSDSDKRIIDEQTYSTSNLVQIHKLVEESNSSQPTLGSISQLGAQQVGEIKVKSDLKLPVMSPSFSLTETKTLDSETGTEMELSQVDDKLMLTGYAHHVTEEEKFVKQDLSHALGSSSTEGLLDDMWDANDHSVEEVSDSESLEGEISESVVDRKTGKSMLNVVAGLVRLRWGSSSETQKSPIKSDQQSTPNNSPGGETRFSENEHDEYIGGDGIKSNQITSSQEPTSSDQSLIMRTAFRGQREDWKNKKAISMPLESASEQPLLRESAGTSQKKDHRNKEQRNMSQEPTSDQSLLPRTKNQSQKGDFKLMSLDDRLGPASVSQIGLVSGSESIGANTDLKMTQLTTVSSPLSPAGPSTRRLRRSDAIEEIEDFEGIEEHKSSESEQRGSSSVLVPSIPQLTRLDAFEATEDGGRNEELISSAGGLKGPLDDVMESRVPTSEEIDTEMTRRMLQRSKQVMSDRFDEWEDAYRRENEQRKVDEFFMREALAEAIKGADFWEVPVGAVLVQNGKVIARGYNLVEELRDSTAHAEMICIREASNILRTWRLSETTLYVTLEPCPMCAGAILQARIGTLVWGAPNKLLGADGSWIRLFPDGVEGEERSEVADKPPAPAHPLHPKINIRRGVLGSECAQIMQQFFQLRRKSKKEQEKKFENEETGKPSSLPAPHKRTKLLRKMHDVFHIT